MVSHVNPDFQYVSSNVMPLKCLDCGARLRNEPSSVVCLQCGRSWPVRNGVPRFFEPDYYWGEPRQEKASILLRDAMELGWREAVARHFAGDDNMQTSILDFQRVSWLPLLDLDSGASALDVGSGYGAITHALAYAVKEVYSLEAIPERIDFTRNRLEQEGICNVQLVQATGLAPPFCDESFDLIVVNGVLEWVGAWEKGGDPRVLQLEFLRKMRTLLRPEGKLVVGIENRFGHDLMRGGRDHSGLPYTSLMPRRLASFFLRHSERAHYRITGAPQRAYRTYTYGEAGYRKLLAEAGFSVARIYWADPGYNQPYSLVPLEGTLVVEYMRVRMCNPSMAARSFWLRRAKIWWARLGLLRWMIPEFLIVACNAKDPGCSPGEPLRGLLTAAPSSIPKVDNPVYWLSTSRYSGRSIVRVFNAGRTSPSLIVRTEGLKKDTRAAVEAEFRALNLVKTRLAGREAPPFSMPEPLGFSKQGGLCCTAESPAAGSQISCLMFDRPWRRQLAYARAVLPRCLDIGLELALLLRGEREVETVNPSWWDLPMQLRTALKKQGGEGSVLSELCSGKGNESDCVQHGDFTIENLFLNPLDQRITVVDWEHLIRGVPPLYDVFSLLVSALPSVVVEGRGEVLRQLPLDSQFLAAFFGHSPWTGLIQLMLKRACERLSVPHAEVWNLFIRFLVLRTNDFLQRPSYRMAEQHARFLRLAVLRRKEFVAGLGGD